MSTSFTLFETPIGPCGIAWSALGIRCLQLPEATIESTEARLRAQTGDVERGEPASWVRDAIARIVQHLEGKPQDMGGLPLDLRAAPEFHRKVYEASRSIGSGRTMTYGELAAQVGSPGAARAVGQAMARNPVAIVVPCHRVLASGNKPGGFSAHGGRQTKARLLALEGRSLPQASPKNLSLFEGELRLPFSPEVGLSHLTNRDPPLARVIKRVGPFRLKLQTAHTPFDALAESILHQQITGKAAAAIAARLRASFGTEGYPAPDAVVRARSTKLRAVGLSASKAKALKDLATKVIDGTVPTFTAMSAMTDEELVERITAVRGIGRWTVEMLLIFRLGRPDVLPTTDYGIRKGFARALRLKELPTPGEVLRRGERWRPFRTIASWYLWRACEEPGTGRA